MPKIALISPEKILTGMPSVWKDSDFQTIQKFDKQYKLIRSFERYFHIDEDEDQPLNTDLTSQFDYVFDSEKEYQQWLTIQDGLEDLIFDMPDAQGYTRKLQSTDKLLIDTPGKQITTGWRVRHFDPGTGQEAPDMEKLVDLVSTEAPLPELGLDNEYKYLYKEAIKNKVSLIDLFVQMIPVAIAAGRIDSKITY